MTVAADFEREGYAILRGRLDVGDIARLEREIIAPYPGPLYRHSLRMLRHSELDPDAYLDLSGLMNAHLWKLPQLNHFSEALLKLLTSDGIYTALNAIDGEARYTLHQSIFFFCSPRIGPHFDNSTLDTLPPARSFTVWIAVDAATPMNGPPYVVPTPRGHYWTDPGTTPPNRNRLIHDWVTTRRMPAMVLVTLNAGDIAVWAPTTPHGSLLGWPDMKVRRSIQAVYRPTGVLSWGNTRASLADYHDPAFEEEEVNSRFNCLRSKRAEADEQFRRVEFEQPLP